MSGKTFTLLLALFCFLFVPIASREGFLWGAIMVGCGFVLGLISYILEFPKKG